MSQWTFYDFIEPSGRNPFFEWQCGLEPEVQAFIDARILQMAGLRRWSEKWVSKYRGTDKIFELRIPYKKVQYRPLGAYAPKFSFILLAGAIEKDWKIPQDIIDAAVRRQKLIGEPGHVRPHRFY